MSSFIPVEIQLACFAIAVFLSVALLLAIKVTEFAQHPVHFRIIHWFCKQSTLCGMEAGGWYTVLMFLFAFGLLGIILTIIGIPFPHSFFASFIVGCLWVLYKDRR